MAKSLEELLAEIERKAKERMGTSPASNEAGATVYEGDATVPGSAATVYEGDATMPEDTATMYEAAAAIPASVSEPSYAKGETLLDTYTVESDPIHGGMGSVWRVHHTGWNVDLAMKRPQDKMFRNEKQKENFIEECKAWINLGLHPNIVSCYYVRELDGVPTIFSEWMENGSLENHIQKGTLYTRSEQEQMERLLDIAIQFARGLHYAHEQGLIHQDVKPDNLLLSKDWDAKVADFGLAKARAQLTVLEGTNTVMDAGATVMAPSGGYTPAYCSMEQMDGKPLTRRTDIYSWAVSVMEMYIGSRPWMNGVVAGLSCRDYFGETRVPMPEALKVLLAQCMAAEPEDRPHDFAEIEAELQKIYRSATGSDYPRPVSTAAADTADSLNNRALSYLDMGKPDAAEAVWKQALEKDGSRFLFHYNYAVFLWNAGKISDAALFHYLKSHNDNSSLYQNTMDALFRMRGNWDIGMPEYSYEKNKRPAEYEPLRPLSNLSVDGRYRVQGYADKKEYTYRYGYRIEDLVSGEVRDYPNVYSDYGESTPRDGLIYLHAHYYKSKDVYFAGSNSELIVMVADVLWFFEAKTGRLILSIPPVIDSDGDSMPYTVAGYTATGLVEYCALGVFERTHAIRLHPNEAYPYMLSCIASYNERFQAEQNAEEYYKEALSCWKQDDILGCFSALNRSLNEQVLTSHGPSLRLWSELSAYFRRGNLVTVIPTDDEPTPLPQRGERTIKSEYKNSGENRNRADNGQTEIILDVKEKKHEYDDCTDIYEFTFEYSLTARDVLSGEVYYEIPDLETSVEEADSRWFKDYRYLALKEDHMLWYAREDADGEWIDLSLRTPHFTLPSGYELFNTEKGVNIGGFVFDDKFDDFRPLWNADVIACSNHNYRLIYRYLISDET